MSSNSGSVKRPTRARRQRLSFSAAGCVSSRFRGLFPRQPQLPDRGQPFDSGLAWRSSASAGDPSALRWRVPRSEVMRDGETARSIPDEWDQPLPDFREGQGAQVTLLLDLFTDEVTGGTAGMACLARPRPAYRRRGQRRAAQRGLRPPGPLWSSACDPRPARPGG
jgi:hypothetical protein